MIVSASRRTDIPAFYSEWFINRVRAGWCTVPNPFNWKQISRVSLHPEDVDAIVFWTRNPQPIFPSLPELDACGHRYVFQCTVMRNPRSLDPGSPSLQTSIKTFRALADRIGPERMIWRYDPIVFSTATGAQFHRLTFEFIAEALRGCTTRSVISLVTLYRKAQRRFRSMSASGVELTGCDDASFADLMRAIADAARKNGMEVLSCAQDVDLQPYGILPGRCIDGDHLSKAFGLVIKGGKDPSQRKGCGCTVSKDIGMYDSCLFGCRYCYATTSVEKATRNFKAHDPCSPSLLGWHDQIARPVP